MMTRLLLRITHRIWNRRIAAILCASFQDGDINSTQLHILASHFDPTQRHQVY